jgi:hypothetical protein
MLLAWFAAWAALYVALLLAAERNFMVLPAALAGLWWMM